MRPEGKTRGESSLCLLQRHYPQQRSENGKRPMHEQPELCIVLPVLREVVSIREQRFPRLYQPTSFFNRHGQQGRIKIQQHPSEGPRRLTSTVEKSIVFNDSECDKKAEGNRQKRRRSWAGRGPQLPCLQLFGVEGEELGSPECAEPGGEDSQPAELGLGSGTALILRRQ